MVYAESASRERVEESIEGCTHLHLACHARFDVDDPLESAFLLAGSDRLTLRDLTSGSMCEGVHLVVASACQSAMVEFNELPDEHIGLASGFLYSGARLVIAGLWPVDDLATALLMRQFYWLYCGGRTATGGGGGQPVAWALRSAQRWLGDLTQDQARQLLRDDPVFRSGSAQLGNDARAYVEGVLSSAERPFSAPEYWAAWVLLGVEDDAAVAGSV